MPYDGSGNYSPAPAPNFPAISGETILALRYNAVINDISAALSNVITRDGQGRPITDIGWNARSLTNVNALGAVTGNFSGTVTAANVTVSGTLSLAAPLAVIQGGTGVITATGTGATVRADSPTFTTTIGVAGPIDTTNGAVLGRFAASAGVSVSLGTVTNHPLLVTINAVERARFDTAGNLGISTITPGTKLHVADAPTNSFNILTSGPVGDNNWGGGIAFRSNNGTTVTALINASTNGMSFAYGGSERMRITNTGAVGIGTSSPEGTLSVRNTAVNGEVAHFDSTATSGINTFAVRNIAASGTAFPILAVRQWRSSFASGMVGQLRFDGLTTTGGYAEFASIYADAGTNTASGAPTALTFQTMDTSFVIAERMRISSAGNVGIGVAAPATRLDIGTGTLTGRRYQSPTLATSYLDLTDIGSGNPGLSFDATDFLDYSRTSNTFTVAIGGTARLQVRDTGISDSLGNVRQFIKASATSGVLTAASANQWVRATAGVTINNSVFAANDYVTIINKSGANMTITQGAGIVITDAFGATGNRTLANHGICNILFNTTSDAIISGTGLS